MRYGQRRRTFIRIFLIAAAAILVASSTPALAEAGGPWAVRSASGKKIGYARTDGRAYSSVKHRVLGPNRVKRGWLQYARMDAWLVSSKALTTPQPSAYVQRIGSSGWWMGPNDGIYPQAWTGRVRKSDGRWVVLLDVDGKWKTRGSVTGKCPAWLAGGAVFILLGDHWR